MGETPKKYHVTEDGDVYRINEDGSFTSMGNAENISKSTQPDKDSQASNSANELYKDSQIKLLNRHNSIINRFMFWLLFILLVGAISYIAYQSHNNVTTNDDIVPADSVMLSNVPIEAPVFEQTDTPPTKQISQNVDEPINQQIKQSEEIIEENSITRQIDEPNTRDNYYVEPPCGQMEGPDNFFVLFPDGKTYLCSAHMRRIGEMLKNLHSYSDYKIVVDGYRSSFTGTHTSNMKDAQLRVSSIVNYLKSKGIPDDRIIAEVHDIDIDYFGPYGHVSIMVE